MSPFGTEDTEPEPRLDVLEASIEELEGTLRTLADQVQKIDERVKSLEKGTTTWTKR
jgi:chaperonin cofactor prefoldin